MKKKTIIIVLMVILCVAAVIAIMDTVSSYQGPSINATSSNTTVSHGTPATTAKVTAKVTTKTTTPTPNKTTVKATATATPKATTTAPVKTTVTLVAYTNAQIYQHLINIAFSSDTTQISKVNSTNEKVSLTGPYNDNDKASVSAFTRQFNSDMSSTIRISEPSTGDQGNIIIHFLPGESLESLAGDTSYNSLNGKQVIQRDDAGTICSIYRTLNYQVTSSDNVYVNSDLTGSKRVHYILRGLLYCLGFPGDTLTYPDSMFYEGPNSNVNMSAIDIKAVQLMYGSKIQNGMTVSAIKGMY
jgi:flagellar basal body-associated protein FliL